MKLENPDFRHGMLEIFTPDRELTQTGLCAESSDLIFPTEFPVCPGWSPTNYVTHWCTCRDVSTN